MRRVINSVAVATLTFAIGIGAVWTIGVLQPIDGVIAPDGLSSDGGTVIIDEDVPREIDLCELTYGEKDFDGEIVTFVTTAYVLGKPASEFILHVPNDVGCENIHPSRPSPIFTELNVSGNDGLKALRDTLQRSKLEIDLRVSGRVIRVLEDRKYPVYFMHPDRVEVISSPRKFYPKGAA